MKVLLYTEGEKVVGKSGLGKAIKHQMKALEVNDVDYTMLTAPKKTLKTASNSATKFHLYSKNGLSNVIT